MNYRELRKHIGDKFKLRPHPIALDTTTGLLTSNEELWELASVQPNNSLKLIHAATRRQISIGRDHQHQFDTPNTLWLSSQVTITPEAVEFESLPRHTGHSGIDAPFQIDLPLAGVQGREWIPVYGSGGPPGHAIFVFTWLVNDRCHLQPGDVEPARDGRWVHPHVRLRARNLERYLFAASVHPDAREAFRSVFSTTVMTVSILERRLSHHRIRFRLTDPRRLQRAQ